MHTMHCGVVLCDPPPPSPPTRSPLPTVNKSEIAKVGHSVALTLEAILLFWEKERLCMDGSKLSVVRGLTEQLLHNNSQTH